MTLKATINELVKNPEICKLELKLDKARRAFINLGTEKERLVVDVAERRLAGEKERSQNLFERRIVRAQADLRDAMEILLKKQIEIGEKFDEMVNAL